jgi:hypothetical protein
MVVRRDQVERRNLDRPQPFRCIDGENRTQPRPQRLGRNPGHRGRKRAAQLGCGEATQQQCTEDGQRCPLHGKDRDEVPKGAQHGLWIANEATAQDESHQTLRTRGGDGHRDGAGERLTKNDEAPARGTVLARVPLEFGVSECAGGRLADDPDAEFVIQCCREWLEQGTRSIHSWEQHKGQQRSGRVTDLHADRGHTHRAFWKLQLGQNM